MSDQDHILGQKKETRDILRAQVFRAVQVIEARLDDPPKTSALAQAVGVSKFHFQRAFQAVVGESVKQHIRRLQAEQAAYLLKYSSWQVADICLASGFPSQSGFCRSFKRLYGITPQEFRKQETTSPFLRGNMRSRKDQSLEDPALPLPTVKMEEWPNLEVVTLRFYGEVKNIYLPWGELLEWARNGIPLLEKARFFGLWFDEWTGTNVSQYRYECAILPSQKLKVPLPQPFTSRTIEGGLVAVSHAHGDLGALDRAWRSFATGWLPISGWQPRGPEVAAIDEYPAQLLLGSKAKLLAKMATGLSMDLCLPVQKGPIEI